MDAPINENLSEGFLGSFLSNNLKTNQLEVNTDSQTSRSVARLKEPRDLFALPKDKDNECSQQTARYPTECQVLDERVYHIEYVPTIPEPYYQPTGRELQPRPVGEENGEVVYSYNPISAVNYINCSDSDSDSGDNFSTVKHRQNHSQKSIVRQNYSDNSSNNSDDENSPIEIDPMATISDNPKNYLSFFVSLSTPNSPSTSPPLERTDVPTTPLAPVSAQNSNKLLQNNLNSIQFSRSSVGGSKYLVNPHINITSDDNDLVFESRFESGNLAKAIKITPVYYELYLRPDLYTNKHTQWFYFRVTNTRKGVPYRLSIVNLVKSGSLYTEGMRPLMYSSIDAKATGIGWRRCGDNISYFKNEDTSNNNDDDDEFGSSTLTFNIEFSHDNDIVYFAHSYPYTYSDLQDYLMAIQKDPVKSKFCKLRLLCRSLAGNNVYYLTVTAPPTQEENPKKKRAIVVSARVHPGETPASWMMKGLMDFITGDSVVAKKLRHKFIFKLIPMLNPDGVIVGNTRSSLTGKDLNRQYRTVIRETYPSIWYTKTMIKRLTEECGVLMYCDMHAHSRKHNIFIYGCENRRVPDKKLSEQVFPLMLHKNVADKFSFESCKFKVQRNKEGTGRIVIWMHGITNSYTMEASFGGSTLGNRTMTHFSTADYEHIGRVFCETLMDFSDENPTKEKLRAKIIIRLNEEGSNAEEPLNISLSDYSSDEGDTSSSSSSENEGKISHREHEGPCCQPLLIVPPSSPVLPDKLGANKKLRKSKGKLARLRATTTTPKNLKKTIRSVIELATTEPDLDCCTTTSDYDEFDETRITTAQHINTKLVRTQQKTIVSEQKMPPELTITGAQQRSSTTVTFVANRNELNKEKFSNTLVSELPSIGGTKRHLSWHNIKKCVRMTDEMIEYQQTTENLKLKLSLKKQIWTGTMCQVSEKNCQPLSWGVPPIVKKPKQPAFDENEELLTECSQRLTIWQQDENKRKANDKKKKQLKNTKNSNTCLDQKYEKRLEIENAEKSRKKKFLRASQSESSQNSFTSLANKSTLSSSIRKTVTTMNVENVFIKTKLGPSPAPNKFKTSGIVATACLNPIIKSKKPPPEQQFSKVSIDNGTSTLIGDSTTANTPVIIKTFVKKVKTKLKKKKR